MSQNQTKNDIKEQIVSVSKLGGLLGFMAFLYINLLIGGVLTVGAGAILVRMFTKQ